MKYAYVIISFIYFSVFNVSAEIENTIKAPNCNIAIGTHSTFYDQSSGFSILINGLKSKGYNQIYPIQSLFYPGMSTTQAPPASEIYFYLSIDTYNATDLIAGDMLNRIDLISPIASALGPNKVNFNYKLSARIGDDFDSLSTIAIGTESKTNYYSHRRNTIKLTKELLESIPNCSTK